MDPRSRKADRRRCRRVEPADPETAPARRAEPSCLAYSPGGDRVRAIAPGMEQFGYPDFLLATADQLIEQQYGDRSNLRPIYDAIIHAAARCGEVVIQARKTYISLVSPRRTFARVQPTTRTRVDLGLRLDGRPARAAAALKDSRNHARPSQSQDTRRSRLRRPEVAAGGVCGEFQGQGLAAVVLVLDRLGICAEQPRNATVTPGRADRGADTPKGIDTPDRNVPPEIPGLCTSTFRTWPRDFSSGGQRPDCVLRLALVLRPSGWRVPRPPSCARTTRPRAGECKCSCTQPALG